MSRCPIPPFWEVLWNLSQPSRKIQNNRGNTYPWASTINLPRLGKWGFNFSVLLDLSVVWAGSKLLQQQLLYLKHIRCPTWLLLKDLMKWYHSLVLQLQINQPNKKLWPLRIVSNLRLSNLILLLFLIFDVLISSPSPCKLSCLPNRPVSLLQKAVFIYAFRPFISIHLKCF